jgi:hypothetical protein
VRLEGKPICPECGKALVIVNPALSSTSGRGFWVLVGIVLAMVLVGGYLWSQSSAKQQQQTVLVATPTPTPTSTPTATPESTPTPTATPSPVPTPIPPTPTPASQTTGVPATSMSSSHDTAFLIKIETALNRHDWQTITAFTPHDGGINYFSKVHASDSYIQQDMEQDARTYSSSHASYYPDTFTHEISNECSPHWIGPMLYDSINVYSEIQERAGRMHKALTRLTVGYTRNDGNYIIYALVMKVLPTQ